MRTGSLGAALPMSMMVPPLMVMVMALMVGPVMVVPLTVVMMPVVMAAVMMVPLTVVMRPVMMMPVVVLHGLHHAAHVTDHIRLGNHDWQ